MRVKILKVEIGELVDANILESGNFRLPTIHEGWRFNFPRHAKDIGAQAYILVTEDTPGIIEGCLIYKMRKLQEPYMAYIEIAPQNRGKEKKYDLVAGCLIAYASRLSFILGKGDYLGWLAFDVLEPSEDGQKKLMTLYSKKYRARKFDETTMFIIPEDGEKLIGEYLRS